MGGDSVGIEDVHNLLQSRSLHDFFGLKSFTWFSRLAQSVEAGDPLQASSVSRTVGHGETWEGRGSGEDRAWGRESFCLRGFICSRLAQPAEH